MKNSILFVSISILTVLCSLVAPWWVIAPISFVVAYLGRMKSAAGFGVPFLAVFGTWLLAIYLKDNGYTLASQIKETEKLEKYYLAIYQNSEAEEVAANPENKDPQQVSF